MNHALIIEENMIVSRAIQTNLEALGFTSFDHTWNEEQAVRAANERPPSLVIVGDALETGSAVEAARRIAAKRVVPVLMVTGDPVRAERRLAKGPVFAGPFLLNQIEQAVNLATARNHTAGERARWAHAALAAPPDRAADTPPPPG